MTMHKRLRGVGNLGNTVPVVKVDVNSDVYCMDLMIALSINEYGVNSSISDDNSLQYSTLCS